MWPPQFKLPAEQDMFAREGKSTNKAIEKGKTLLVDGPASVMLISGKAEVFGFSLVDSRQIIVLEGKRLPFTILEYSNFDIALGEGAGITEVKDSTIPCNWKTAVDMLREIHAKVTSVMVVGGVDSGKSSFSTYLANRLVSENCRVVVLDEDLGQSDIGPPSTVAYAYVSKPITDLFALKPNKVVFVGVTSPSEAQSRTVEATAALIPEIRARADFIIVNTDGWVLGEDAIAFKKRLAEIVKPDVIFFLHRVCQPFISGALAEALRGYRLKPVDSPVAVMERNSEKRRSLRELGFLKYLENARNKVFQLGQVKVEGAEEDSVLQSLNVENLLVGLHSAHGRFLGLGIIRGFDIGRKLLKVYTAVDETPAILSFGNVRLNENLREIPKTC